MGSNLGDRAHFDAASAVARGGLTPNLVLPAVAGSSSADALRNGNHSNRADVRFARLNIQIYDAQVVDLYQWVAARYLVGVTDAETKKQSWSTIEQNNNFPYISMGYGERASVNPLKDKVFSTFLTKTHRLILRSANGVSHRQNP
jgi:hypothetical protein